MNLTKLSPHAQCVLEGMNLALGVSCALVGAYCGVTSPRVWPEVPMVTYLQAATTVLGLPLLVLTSAMLLFSDRRRAALGFALLLVAVLGMANASIVME